jgi:8-oxo-dGTP pyrophosphatase MutT (NUDIX family)
MLTIHAIGHWPEGAVRATWTDTSRPLLPDVEAAIERAWAAKSAEPGVLLFDGPMCRLERWSATPEQLDLSLATTSYKAFVGTNMAHPELADRHGPAALANPLGLSVLIESSDGLLLLGRRSAAVAYYPGRVHPFAGAMEPADGTDVFAAARREMAEELGLAREAVGDLACVGMIEDRALRQPELVFHARPAGTARELLARLSRVEHRGTCAVTVDPPAVDRALADPALTPVAVGSLLLWGRAAFGDAWFAAARNVLP